MPAPCNEDVSFDAYLYNFINDWDGLCDIGTPCLPNMLSFANVFVGTVAALLLRENLKGYNFRTFTTFGFLVLLRSVLDIADGAIARNCGWTSTAGAWMDVFADVVFVLAIVYVCVESLHLRTEINVVIAISVCVVISFSVYIKDVVCQSSASALLHDNTIPVHIALVGLVRFCIS